MPVSYTPIGHTLIDYTSIGYTSVGYFCQRKIEPMRAQVVTQVNTSGRYRVRHSRYRTHQSAKHSQCSMYRPDFFDAHPNQLDKLSEKYAVK
jgi:hypothetical protein